MKKAVKSIVCAAFMFGIQSASAEAYDLLGFRPGQSLTELREMYAAGISGHAQSRIACTNDEIVRAGMSSSTVKQLTAEFDAGLTACYVVNIDPANAKSWQQARFKVGTGEVMVKLYFVKRNASPPVLATISVSPTVYSDAVDMTAIISADLGKPKREKRRFRLSSELIMSEEAPTWEIEGGTVVTREGRYAFFFDAALTGELRARLDTLPDGSTFSPLPIGPRVDGY